jgi:hypothetical protein
MTDLSNRSMKRRGFWQKAVLAAVLATVLGGAAIGPALAASDDWRQDRWRQEERWRHEERWREHRREEAREREWREHHRTVYAPGYYYEAPTPYYYSPPPVPPGINFVFPLNIR